MIFREMGGGIVLIFGLELFGEFLSMMFLGCYGNWFDFFNNWDMFW